MSGECARPDELSCVADTVFRKTGQQVDLVDRLPLHEFRNASPNEGHLVAAAILRERVITDILTLNFDLALAHALSHVCATYDVAVISGEMVFTSKSCSPLNSWTHDAHWQAPRTSRFARASSEPSGHCT